MAVCARRCEDDPTSSYCPWRPEHLNKMVEQQLTNKGACARTVQCTARLALRTHRRHTGTLHAHREACASSAPCVLARCS
eukprot:6201924-Prymnesium_polylepis.1